MVVTAQLLCSQLDGLPMHPMQYGDVSATHAEVSKLNRSLNIDRGSRPKSVPASASPDRLTLDSKAEQGRNRP